MIAETIGLIAIIAITIFFIWRISVTNKTLFESPVFRVFLPIIIIPIMTVYVLVVFLKWSPTLSFTGVGTITLLAATGAYLQMPFGSEHFFAHLKIIQYDIAPRRAWIEVNNGNKKLIGEVIYLKTTAITLKDEEGTLWIIENQTFLNGNPRRLEITQHDGNIVNNYLYRIDVALPFNDTVDYMTIKKNIRKKIIEKQLETYSIDETGADGKVIDTSTMTGFVFDDMGSHISPRVYFDITPSLSGNPYVQFVILIPSRNYWEGWVRWHSYIANITQQCYVEKR
jgi:hypothetical protein